MMKPLALALLLAGLPGVGHTATITIGVDLSGSNPLLGHENFAQAAAQYVTQRIAGLNSGDSVRLYNFGSRDDALNLLDYEFTISRRQRANKVAAAISGFIQSLPERENAAQSATNLIAWLEFTSGFDCNNGGQILVFTDALEASDYVDPMALLDGSTGLPDADVDLTGCTLTFYGLGAGFPAPQVKNIRNAWRQWADQAGADFDAVIR